MSSRETSYVASKPR